MASGLLQGEALRYPSALLERFERAADRAMIWNQLHSLRRDLPLLLFATVFGGVFGYISALQQPYYYHAAAVLRIPPGRRTGRGSSLVDVTGPRQDFLTEIYLLKSESLARQVTNELNLGGRRDFLGYTPPSNLDAEQQAAQVERAATMLRQRVSVLVEPDTDLVRIGYSSTNPKLAAAVVNTVMDDFLEQRFARRYRGAGRAEQLLGDRLAALRAEFISSQFRLLRLQEELQTPGFSPRRNQIAADLAGLAARERTAKLARLEDENRAALLKSESRGAAAGAGLVLPPMNRTADVTADEARRTPDPSAVEQEQIRRKLNEARQQQALFSSLQGPNNPAAVGAAALVKSYEEEIAGQDALIVTAAEQRAAADAGAEQGIRTELDARVADAQALEPVVEEYSTLERKYVFARVLYYRFLTRLRSATVSAGLAQSDILVVDRAEVPVVALYRGWKTSTFGGALLSLFFSAILIRMMRYRSSLLLRVEHLERITGLPALATLPQLGRFVLTDYAELLATGRPLGAAPAGRDQFVDGIFDLAWAVGPSLGHTGQARILMTSTAPGEGKTSVSAALALTLAHSGRRTLLIDADLHRPMIAGRLGLRERVGLSSVLSKVCVLDQAVQQLPNAPNLDVLTSGPMPPNPDRVLASNEMRVMLAEADARYDVIILDAPPVLAVQDALVLSQVANDVVWVMRDMNARLWLTRRTRKLLEKAGAPVRGLVINGTALPRQEERARAAVSETFTVAG